MHSDLAVRFRDVTIVGIVNITRDSFSDGGRYFDPHNAVEHARRLHGDGADIIDLGPASSHPKAEMVSAAEEITRLLPVATVLADEGIPLSVDSPLGETQRWAAERGFAQINDIRGFPDPAVARDLAGFDCQLVVMHSIQRGLRADYRPSNSSEVVAGVHELFETRVAELQEAGIARERLILDPGMGYFLGSEPTPSIAVLRDLPRLVERFQLPVYVSLARKSFLGVLTDRPTEQRDPATLSAELYAIEQGASYIRTHQPGPLRDACRVQAALRGAE